MSVRKKWFSSALLAAVAILAGCNDSSTAVNDDNNSGSEGQATVRVGFLGDYSGVVSGVTPSIEAAAKLAVEHVNEHGLLDDHQLELKIADSGCSAADAEAGARELIESEDVIAIVGALCSNATLAAAENVTIEAGVLLISPASTSPALSSLEDNDLVFRTVPSDSVQGASLAAFADGQSVNDLALLVADSDVTKSIAAEFKSAFDGTIQNEATFNSESDFGALVQDVMSGSSALTISAALDADGDKVMSSALGEASHYLLVEDMLEDGLFDVDGFSTGDLDGKVLGVRATDTDSAGADAYQALAESGGLDPGASFAPNAYDAVFMLALALESKGNADREHLNIALRNIAAGSDDTVILPGEWDKALTELREGRAINYEGAAGNQDFNASGDVNGSFVRVTVADDQFVEGELITGGFDRSLRCLSDIDSGSTRSDQLTGSELASLLMNGRVIQLGGREEDNFSGSLAMTADCKGDGSAELDNGETLVLQGSWEIRGNEVCRTWLTDGEVCEQWVSLSDTEALVYVGGDPIGYNSW